MRLTKCEAEQSTQNSNAKSDLAEFRLKSKVVIPGAGPTPIHLYTLTLRHADLSPKPKLLLPYDI